MRVFGYFHCDTIERLFFVVGLDAAGKTTILYKLKLGEIVTTIPTIGAIALFVKRFDLPLLSLRLQRGDGRV